MARELRITIWCDACAEDGDKRTDGDEFTVAVNGGAARTLALCPDHTASILAPLARLLANAPAEATTKRAVAAAADDGSGVYVSGRRVRRDSVAAARATDSPYLCPYGDGYHVTSRTSIGKHLRVYHDTDVIRARSEFPEWGARLPTRARMAPDDPGYREHKCPEKGCGHVSMTAQGFGAHLRSHKNLSKEDRQKISKRVVTRASAASVSA